jgi:hypothetical protein
MAIEYTPQDSSPPVTAIDYEPQNTSGLVSDPAEGGSFSASNEAELAGAQSFAAKAKEAQNAAEQSEANALASASEAATSLAAQEDLEVTSASFDTAGGTLTLTKANSGTVTTDLDGRYAELTGADFTGDVTTTGNVGIGATSPANTLTVGATENSTIDQDATVGIKCNANHKGIMLQENSGAEQWSIGVGEAGSLKFYDSAIATPAVTFEDNTGNVGIGTDSPAYNLDIEAETAQARIHSTVGNSVLRLDSVDDGESKIYFADNSASAIGTIEYHHDSNYMSFDTVATERMRIDSAGKVGIGTINPQAKLHVNGGDLKITSDNSNTGEDGIPSILFGEVTNDSAHAQISYHGDDEATDDNYIGLGVFDPTQISADTLAEQKLQNTLAVTRDNKVGINIIRPTEALDVNGNIAVSGDATVGGELTVTGSAEAELFKGDLEGAIHFKGAVASGATLTKGDVVYVSGYSGGKTEVDLADASDSNKMPAFGIVAADPVGVNVDVVTFGTLKSINTSTYTDGDELYVDTTAGGLTATAPSGEGNLVQKIAKVVRASNSGNIKVMGAGRTNATPNLNNGNIFIGDSNNLATTASFATQVADATTGKADLSGADFTGVVTIADDTSLEFGNNDLRIYHDSTSNSSFIREQGTGSFAIQGNNLVLSDTNSSKYLFGIAGGQTSLYYNGTEKLNTKSAGIGVTGDITLTGTVDGVDIATLNSNAIVDGDFTTAGIMTTDGSGSYSVDASTYLTAHQDISGKADVAGDTFTGDVLFNDGVKAKFGTDSDLLIYHNNGEPSVIEDAGELGLLLKTNGNVFGVVSDTNESMITAVPDGGVTLYHDGTAKVTVSETSVAIGDDLQVQSGNDLYVQGGDLDVTGDIIVSGTVDGVDVATLGANAITAHQDISGKANLSGATFTGDVRLSDDVELKLGDGVNGDLRIFHSSANSTTTIREQGTGSLLIQGENLNVTDTSSNSYLSAIAGGSTKIHYNGSTRLETVTGGISVSGDIAVTGTVDGRDVLADGTKLDLIEANATADQTDAEIKTAYENNADTNAFTDAEKTKLSNIEASATADQTGAEIKTAYEAEADTNAFTDAEKTKLSNIEASADVTDTTNVTAAGALMDSEVTNLAQVKAFDSSDYLTAHQDISGKANLSGATFSGNVSIGTPPSSTSSLLVAGVSNLYGGASVTGNITVTGTVDGRDVAADGARLDEAKKIPFSQVVSQQMSGSSPVTILDLQIPQTTVPSKQAIDFSMAVRRYNATNTLKKSSSYNILVQVMSKSSTGVSLGTATYSSAPSTYNAWYYVSGDKTHLMSNKRGKFAASSTGSNSTNLQGLYYDDVNDRTYFRISKYPDATSAYNNVEVFYSLSGFTSPGTYVTQTGNKTRYNSLEPQATTSQSISLQEILPETTSRSYVRLQFDPVSSVTSITTYVEDLSGHVENLL